jgi:hypothetical protein
MTDIYVFDASALMALFRAYRPVFRLFMEADAGRVQLVFPAAAIGEANTYVHATEGEWEPLLMGRAESTPLTEHIAITVGTWPGDLATRHVVYEAQAVRGDIVTREPGRYHPWTVPLLEL